MTFRRALRTITKRWWLLLAGGVVVAILAFLVAGQKKAHYEATTVLTVNDVTVVPRGDGKAGFQVFADPPKFPDSWVTQDFISQSAAQAASSQVGGRISANAMLSHIVVTGLTNSTVELDFTGNGSSADTLAALKRYASALLSQRAAREQNLVLTALNTMHTNLDQTPAVVSNESRLTKVLQQIPGFFSSDFQSNRPPSAHRVSAGGPPTALIVLGGFLAGVAGGALLALLLGRFDKRVRRPDDIEVSGVPVVDIDSEVDAASVQLLRSELELAGMGTRLAVIAVTRATRAEGSSGLALALARTFASVGTPTVLVSADLRARKVRSEMGLSGLLDGSVSTLPLIPLESNLAWLPEGSSTALPETLFSAPRVERIIRDLRDQAGVIVIDTPAVLEDSETLPLLASSDIVLLTVRPGLTRWNPLGAAVALIQRVAKRPLHICYDRADEASSVPAAATRRSEVSERVHQAIEVPASS